MLDWRYRVSTPPPPQKKKPIILWFSMIKVLFWFFKMMLKIDNPLVLVVYWTGGGVKRNQIWCIFFQSPLPLGYTHPNPAPTPLRRKGKNIGIFQGSLSAPRFFLLYFTETFWNQNFRVPYFSAVMPPPPPPPPPTPPNPTDYHALNNEPSRKCVQTNQTNVEYYFKDTVYKENTCKKSAST